MPRKHILFIVENLPVPYDRRVWAEALAAKEWGYEVSVISPEGKGADKTYERIEGIDVYRHPMPVEASSKWLYLFEYLNALFWETFLSIKIFLKNRFHVIHGANPPDHVFLIALVFKIFGTKYAFDHHDLSTELYIAKFGRSDIFHKFLLIMEKLNLRTADVVISTNESYKKIAITRGRKTTEEVFVVRNGPDLSRIVIKPPEKEVRNGFDHLVAYVGNIGSQEDIDALLRIIKYVVQKRKINDTKFVIVGTGPYWKKMVALSEEMGVSKYVDFTGLVSYEKLLGMLSQADICVNPEYRNSYSEKSTMLKIMDYMIVGKPIVQFDLTEAKVTADKAAIYIENNNEVAFAETIIGLLRDSDKRKEMGEIGRRRILDSLNWEVQRLKLREAYQWVERMVDK